MLNLKTEQIPEFLKKSQLFESLTQDKPETIPVPERYYITKIGSLKASRPLNP